MIIYDFEVFKHNVLLGTLDTDTDKIIQLWDIPSIKSFARDNLTEIWVGYNCEHYDKILLHRDSVWTAEYFRQSL